MGLPRRAGLWRGLALLLLVALAVGSAALLPEHGGLSAAVAWARGAGALGVAAYFALFVLAATLMVPKALLVFGAGFAFGAAGGLALGLSAAVAAASLSLVLGRTVGRPWVASRVAKDPRWAAVDEAVARDGFGLVLLLRLSPVFPYGLVNYGLGLTRVRPGEFAVASALGMLPINALYAWMGSVAPTVAEALRGGGTWSGWDWARAATGLVATVAVLLLLARAARRGLEEALEGKGNGTA